MASDEIVKIVIPSHKRADRVRAASVVKNGAICVPQSQCDEYAKHNPGQEIIAHPDSVIGVSAKRQWIYSKFGNVFMLDDDCVGVYRTWVHPKQLLAYKLSPQCAYDAIQATASTAREMGAYLFGFAMHHDPRNYAPIRPFGLNGYVNACSMGLLAGSKLFFDPKMKTCEDYFICGINAYYHRYCFRDERFGCQFENTWHNPGGLSEFRNVDEERRSFERLLRAFGPDVIGRRLKKAKCRGRLAHPWQVTFTLPF